MLSVGTGYIYDKKMISNQIFVVLAMPIPYKGFQKTVLVQ